MTWNGFKLLNGLDDGLKSVQRFQGFGQRFEVWCNGSDLIHVYGVTVSGLVQRFRFGSVWNNGFRFGTTVWIWFKGFTRSDLVQGFGATVLILCKSLFWFKRLVQRFAFGATVHFFHQII